MTSDNEGRVMVRFELYESDYCRMLNSDVPLVCDFVEQAIDYFCANPTKSRFRMNRTRRRVEVATYISRESYDRLMRVQHAGDPFAGAVRLYLRRLQNAA